MQDAVRTIRRPDESAKRPYDDELQPAERVEKTAPGVEWRAFEQPAPWVPRLDEMKSDSHGTQPRPDLAVSPRKNDVALLFTGYLEVPEDGAYTFHVTADTGALLRIHDATVIDADFGHAPGSEVSGAVRLQAGKHPFRLYYARRQAGTPQLALQWSRAALPKQDIPATAFSHRAGSDTSVPLKP
jgi:hypothetical protein